MDSENTTQQIRELERLRLQKRLWQYGVSAALICFVLISLLRLKAAATALTTRGEAQTRFVTDLNNRLQHSVMPSIEEMGSQALHEIDFGAEVKKLNQRTPELAQASLEQMKLLNTHLSQRGQQVLNDTLQHTLKERESKIRAMYPDLTDEQMANLMANLTKEAQEQVADVNLTLFEPHQKALNNIVENMTLIQHTEPIDAKTEPATWEMGLMIFDIARADLKGLEPQTSPTSPSTQTPSNVKGKTL